MVLPQDCFFSSRPPSSPLRGNKYAQTTVLQPRKTSNNQPENISIQGKPTHHYKPKPTSPWHRWDWDFRLVFASFLQTLTALIIFFADTDIFVVGLIFWLIAALHFLPSEFSLASLIFRLIVVSFLRLGDPFPLGTQQSNGLAATATETATTTAKISRLGLTTRC